MLALILDNIRSTHNVGSIFRSADGFGVQHIYIAGYTPYPLLPTDDRLPHLARKIDTQIAKTALGAEQQIAFSLHANVVDAMRCARDDGYSIVALEQAPNAIDISVFTPSGKTAILVGNEVSGMSKETLQLADKVIEIPMRGTKESFNVAVATAVALYALNAQ